MFLIVCFGEEDFVRLLVLDVLLGILKLENENVILEILIEFYKNVYVWLF